MSGELELRHLRYFVAVAEELHFGRAAARLHMAQPPLSQQIRRLEELAGARLFTRTSRSVALTEAGAALLVRARQLLAQAEAGLDEAARIGRGEAGRLDVCYIASAAVAVLVPRVRAFRAAHPDVRVRLDDSFTTEVQQRLVDGTADVGIVRDAEDSPELEAVTVAAEPFVAVLPADHPCAAGGRRSVAAGELAGEPLLFFPHDAGPRAHERNLRPFREAGREPVIAQTAGHWSTILHLVAAGLGVTVAPRSAATLLPEGLRALELAGTSAQSEIQLVRRRGDDRPLVRRFLGYEGASLGEG